MWSVSSGGNRSKGQVDFVGTGRREANCMTGHVSRRGAPFAGAAAAAGPPFRIEGERTPGLLLQDLSCQKADDSAAGLSGDRVKVVVSVRLKKRRPAS